MAASKLDYEKGITIIEIIGVVLVAKLFTYIFKSEGINKKQIHSSIDSEGAIVDIKSSIATSIKESEVAPLETPFESGRNKWLYPTDDLGKLERGRIL